MVEGDIYDKLKLIDPTLVRIGNGALVAAAVCVVSAAANLKAKIPHMPSALGASAGLAAIVVGMMPTNYPAPGGWESTAGLFGAATVAAIPSFAAAYGANALYSLVKKKPAIPNELFARSATTAAIMGLMGSAVYAYVRCHYHPFNF